MDSSKRPSFTDWNMHEFLRTVAAARPAFFAQGKCFGQYGHLFFAGKGGSSKMRKAQKICRSCRIQVDCFDYAYSNNITDGVWGGATPAQRAEWTEKGLDQYQAWDELQLTRQTVTAVQLRRQRHALS